MKKELTIEWSHTGSNLDSIMCENYEEIGSPLTATLAEISMLLDMEGVSVRIIETISEAGEDAEPDSLSFNGVPIEVLLQGVEVITTPCSCASCDSCVSCEEEAECRILRYNGEAYDAIPPELIGRAAAKALDMQ